MKILKFGGKSLSSPEKTQNICKNIKKIYKNDKNIIIVVSAIGNSTDTLLSLAEKYSPKTTCKAELAKLLSTGETVSSSLFSMMLNKMGVPAKSFSAYELEIKTFGDPLDSRIAYINKTKLNECFKNNIVAVVAGFQGINSNNEITTLGRGGSDTTAAALGVIFNTPIEIYSDFNGVFSGDPRILKFKKLKKINFDFMLKMAKAGAKVLHHRAVYLARKYNTKIISKSSTEFNLSGTEISDIENDIISISEISPLSKITINFSNQNKLKFIIKNVLSCIINNKFYNLTINNDEISFFVETSNKLNILNEISKKLNILSK